MRVDPPTANLNFGLGKDMVVLLFRKYLWGLLLGVGASDALRISITIWLGQVQELMISPYFTDKII